MSIGNVVPALTRFLCGTRVRVRVVQSKRGGGGYGSDELDDTDGDGGDDDENDQPASKKRKLGKAAMNRLKGMKAKAKAKAEAQAKGKGKGMGKGKGKAKKGKKGSGDDEDYEDGDGDGDEDEDEDEYTMLSRGGFTRAGTGNVLPPAGSFENCAKCGKRFTVVRVLFSFTSTHSLLISHRGKYTYPDTIHNGRQSRPRVPVPRVRKGFRHRSV